MDRVTFRYPVCRADVLAPASLQGEALPCLNEGSGTNESAAATKGTLALHAGSATARVGHRLAITRPRRIGGSFGERI